MFPYPSQQLVHIIVLVEYENLTVSGCVILVVGLGGNRRRSITKVIMELKTLGKVVEQRAEGLEEVVEHMEILEIEKIVVIIIKG
jgi:hypothetical protein